jgi:hypothetical protein
MFTAFEKNYENIFDLAKGLAENHPWSGIIKSSSFLDFVKKEDEAKAERLRKLILQSIPEDVLVFRVRGILNPYLPFAFHGKTYEHLQNLGEEMLSYSPSPDFTLLSILRYGLLSEYMKTTLYADNHKDEYLEILKIEIESRSDLVYGYYLMGYHLSKSQAIIYDNVRYENIYNFTYYLAKKEKDLRAFGAYLSFSPLLRAYATYSKEGDKVMRYLHLTQQLDKSKSELEDFLEKRKR